MPSTPESRGPAYGAIYSLYRILDCAIYFHPGVHHFKLSAGRDTGEDLNLMSHLPQKGPVSLASNLPKETFTLAGKSTMMVNDSPLEKQRFPDLIWHESNEKDVGTFHRKKVPTSFSFLLPTLEQPQMLLKRPDFEKQLQNSLKSSFVGDRSVPFNKSNAADWRASHNAFRHGSFYGYLPQKSHQLCPRDASPNGTPHAMVSKKSLHKFIPMERRWFSRKVITTDYLKTRKTHCERKSHLG